jgi:hypothetical protein
MKINLSFKIIIRVWEGAIQNWVSSPYTADTNLFSRLTGNSWTGHRVMQLKFADIIKQDCDRKSLFTSNWDTYCISVFTLHTRRFRNTIFLQFWRPQSLFNFQRKTMLQIRNPTSTLSIKYIWSIWCDMDPTANAGFNSSCIVKRLFVEAGTCLQSHCLDTHVSSGYIILTFGRHVTFIRP